jgi:nucleoside-diphosphate-sugar epimerase
MRVFLTGATGFIGSHLVRRLVQAGHHAVGLSRAEIGAEALARAGPMTLGSFSSSTAAIEPSSLP